MGLGRRKNFTLLCGSIFVLIVFIGVGFLLKNGMAGYILGVPMKPVTYIETKIKNLEERKLEDEEILFNGNKAPFDKVTQTLYIPQNTDIDYYVGGLSCNDATLYFEDNEGLLDRNNAIKKADTFKMYVVFPNCYSQVSVVFTGLAVVELNGIYELGEDTYGGYVEVTDPDLNGNDRFISTACNFGIRGDISRGYPKKSYTLKLTDRSAPLLGMRDDDDWVLNALYDDIGMIRNKTAYELWNEISASNNIAMDNTIPGVEYVDVIKDNEYLGVYGFFERLDNKTLGIFGDESIYKIIHYETEDDFEESMEIAYPAPEVGPDGKEIPWDDEDMDPMCDMLEKMCNEDPSDNVNLWDDVLIENAIDYNIFCMALTAHDNLSKNSFYTLLEGEDGKRDFFEVPWDLNATFGVVNQFYYDEDKIDSTHEWSLAARRLFIERPDEFTRLTLERWNFLRSNVLSQEHVKGLIKENLQYLDRTGAMKRNIDRWPRIDFTKTDRKYKELWKKKDIYNFIDKRFEFLDEFFKHPVLISWEDEGSSDQQGIGSSDIE